MWTYNHDSALSSESQAIENIKVKKFTQISIIFVIYVNLVNF